MNRNTIRTSKGMTEPTGVSFSNAGLFLQCCR